MADLPRWRRATMAAALLAACCGAAAQAPAPQRITIAATATQPVEKSYRRMIRGIELFERAKAALAPQATLRFKLLPRKPGTEMRHVILEVIGTSFSSEVPVAADDTFVLERDARALAEDAVVSTNRRRLTMTWRTEIRTPGLPAHVRRLGDLRLECRVGIEADLVSDTSPLGRIADLFTTPEGYCDRPQTRYLFFAERPIFSVTLADGARREVLAIDRLYAGASDDPTLPGDLSYCDCEVLLDRTYFLPLGDPGWSDETRVEFEFMDEQR